MRKQKVEKVTTPGYIALLSNGNGNGYMLQGLDDQAVVTDLQQTGRLVHSYPVESLETAYPPLLRQYFGNSEGNMYEPLTPEQVEQFKTLG
jgi:hypothetical protein